MIKSASTRSNGLPKFLGSSLNGQALGTSSAGSKSESSSPRSCKKIVVSRGNTRRKGQARGTCPFDALVHVSFEATEQAEQVEPHRSFARRTLESSLGQHGLDEI